MLDLVVIDGQRARHRRARSGHRRDRAALGRRGRPRHGRLRQRVLICRRTRSSNVTATWRAHKKGAAFANPCYTQIHPTCIPVTGDYQSKLTLMSESLRNDGRVWVPKSKGDKRTPEPDSRGRARLLPRAQVPVVRQSRRRATSPRATRSSCATRAAAWARAGWACTSTSATRSSATAGHGPREVRQPLPDVRADHRRDPYKVPMRIYPAVHYTMGGLWVDYNLMTHDPRPVRAPARPTSPITAPTASARARSCRDWPTATSSCRTRIGNYLAVASSQADPDGAAFKTAEAAVKARARQAAGDEGQADASTSSTGSSATSCGKTAAWRATRRASRRRSRRSGSCASTSGPTSALGGRER